MSFGYIQPGVTNSWLPTPRVPGGTRNPTSMPNPLRGLGAGPRPALPIFSAARTALFGLGRLNPYVSAALTAYWAYGLMQALFRVYSAGTVASGGWTLQTRCPVDGPSHWLGTAITQCYVNLPFSGIQPGTQPDSSFIGTGWSQWHYVGPSLSGDRFSKIASWVRSSPGAWPGFNPAYYAPLEVPRLEPWEGWDLTPKPARPYMPPEPQYPAWVDPLTATPNEVPWRHPSSQPAPPVWVVPYIQPNPWRSPTEQPRRYTPKPWPGTRPAPNPGPGPVVTDPGLPSHPEPKPVVNFEVLPDGRLRQVPPHRYAPPKRYEKEIKGRGRALVFPASMFKKGLSVGTEGIEVVNALYDCLPASYRKAAIQNARNDGHKVGGKSKKKDAPHWFDRSGYNKGNQAPTAVPFGYKTEAIYNYISDEIAVGPASGWLDNASKARPKRGTGSGDLSFYDCARKKIGENMVEDLILGHAGQQSAKASQRLGLPTGVQTGPAL